jgi:uncharacterized protein (TIGR03118 family)
MKSTSTGFILLLAIGIAGAACRKNNNNYNTNPASPITGNYQQTNLVSDTGAYPGARIDPALIDAWGIAINPTGVIWIAANGTGSTTVYDSTGKTLLGPVAIPFGGVHFGGAPSGVLFNTTTDFVIPANQQVAKFIFSTENGTIAAWSGGDSTLTVVDNSAKSTVYKGIALANDGTGNFIYATDFRGGKIDVYDKSFTAVSRPFSDPGIPAGFGPFNIQNIGGQLYVTYAKLQAPENMDDQAGPGNGYVDVFNPNGSLIKRFASQGSLNSPWGIAQAPAGFGLPLHSILVGNFGDGWINVYDSTGIYLGPLLSNGNPLVIDGLWALAFPVNTLPAADPNKLYFTAGPGDENHGLFGYLKVQ